MNTLCDLSKDYCPIGLARDANVDVWLDDYLWGYTEWNAKAQFHSSSSQRNQCSNFLTYIIINNNTIKKISKHVVCFAQIYHK